MLYLNSILFTMLRNYGIKKLREALCTDMVEYLSFQPTLSPQMGLSPRKGSAVRPPIELADRAARNPRSGRRFGGRLCLKCHNSARISPRPGQLPLNSPLAFSPSFARPSFELPQQVSVVGHRALSSA